MLIAIVLDRPLAEAKALVEAPDASHPRQTESSSYCANGSDLPPAQSTAVPPEATATESP